MSCGMEKIVYVVERKEIGSKIERKVTLLTKLKTSFCLWPFKESHPAPDCTNIPPSCTTQAPAIKAPGSASRKDTNCIVMPSQTEDKTFYLGCQEHVMVHMILGTFVYYSSSNSIQRNMCILQCSCLLHALGKRTGIGLH